MLLSKKRKVGWSHWRQKGHSFCFFLFWGRGRPKNVKAPGHHRTSVHDRPNLSFICQDEHGNSGNFTWKSDIDRWFDVLWGYSVSVSLGQVLLPVYGFLKPWLCKRHILKNALSSLPPEKQIICMLQWDCRTSPFEWYVIPERTTGTVLSELKKLEGYSMQGEEEQRNGGCHISCFLIQCTCALYKDMCIYLFRLI